MTIADTAISSAPVSSPIASAKPPAIQCVDVWKQYYYYSHRPRKIKEAMAQTILRRRRPKSVPVWQLQNFNLTVYPGETVGVVGHNGAGKSTLLKILSRIHAPTRGTVKINGRLSAIIELGAGFHEDLSGRENVYLAASFMGLRKREVDKLYPSIVDFSELGEHMNTPVKYYSSGMQARLGFSIAVTVDPAVLLVDEVLAVGDAKFQPKCKDKIRKFQHDGKAILLVSHDLDTVRGIAQRVIWMMNGQIMAEGEPNETINAYLEHYWPGCTKK